MSWILIALIAQTFSALVFLADKYLVGLQVNGRLSNEQGNTDGKSPNVRPGIYAFYVGMLSGLVVWLLPFGVISWPQNSLIGLSLATAAAYITSLLFLYRSLQKADASDVAPVMGAISALSSLFFSWWILKDQLADNFLIAFFLLVFGTMLMSYFRFNFRSFLNVLWAGVLFGLSSVLVKEIFSQTTFWNGFFWSRMGNVVIAGALLIWPNNWRAIFGHLRRSPGQVKALVVGNKVLAGFAFLLILWAIQLGDVSVVNAISGVQFVFLIVLALIFAKKFPAYFTDAVKIKTALIQKIVATGLIIIGYYFLFI